MYIRNPLSIPKIGFFFFLLSIFFFSIDSFPLFPFESVYRPISIIFLAIPLMFYICQDRLHQATPWLIIGIGLIFVHSIFATEILFNQSEHLTKTAITLILLIILTVTLFTVINDGFKKRKVFFDEIGKVSFWALFLVLSVSFVQVLMMVGVFPTSMSDQITHIFSYRSSQRIQGVSGEPSQMIRSLILLIILVYYLYFKSYRKIILFLSFIVLALSGSTFGYVTIMLMFLVFLVLFKFSLIFNYKSLLLSTFIILSFVFLKDSLLDNYTNAKIDAVWSILSSMDLESVNLVLQYDGSIFQRVINPIIGFISGLYSNFLGVGLDGYRYIYPEIINTYFPYAINFETVDAAVSGENYITPKSLYSKVFAELGLIPFVVMLSYYFWLFLHVKRMKNIGLSHLLFVYVVVVPINADSIIYFNYFFAIIFLHISLKKRVLLLRKI